MLFEYFFYFKKMLRNAARVCGVAQTARCSLVKVAILSLFDKKGVLFVYFAQKDLRFLLKWKIACSTSNFYVQKLEVLQAIFGKSNGLRFTVCSGLKSRRVKKKFFLRRCAGRRIEAFLRAFKKVDECLHGWR